MILVCVTQKIPGHLQFKSNGIYRERRLFDDFSTEIPPRYTLVPAQAHRTHKYTFKLTEKDTLVDVSFSVNRKCLYGRIAQITRQTTFENSCTKKSFRYGYRCRYCGPTSRHSTKLGLSGLRTVIKCSSIRGVLLSVFVVILKTQKRFRRRKKKFFLNSFRSSSSFSKWPRKSACTPWCANCVRTVGNSRTFRCRRNEIVRSIQTGLYTTQQMLRVNVLKFRAEVV